MKTSITIVILLLSQLTCRSQSDSVDIIIKNISIIDTKQKSIIHRKTIYIKDERIVKIENFKKSKKYISKNTIDGKGKFISTGFWDMHIHTCWKENLDESVFPTLFDFGITGIRDMGGSLKVLNTFKHNIENKDGFYPNIFGAGPILDGEKPVHPDFSVPLKIGNIKTTLDSLKINGADFLKVYSLLPKVVFDSISFYSKELNLSFAGHIPEYVTPERAIALGQKSIEHLNGLEELINDTIRFSSFIQLAHEQKTWFCPTLILYMRKNEILKGHFEYNDLFKGLDSDLKNEWEQVKNKRQNKIVSETELLKGNLRFENQKKIVKIFYDNNLPFLLGTDFAGMQFIYPGYSLHEEMKLLSSIGVNNFDILKMATYNPVEFLGIAELYGTIDVNKIADLVIFSENPVEDIENSKKIELVIKNGQVVMKK